jgi:hypothetical protein
MGFFILEMVLFILGCAALVIGRIPLKRRRWVNGSAARVVGAILMIPLPVYMVVCKHSHVPLLGPTVRSLDPLERVGEEYARLFGLGVAAACLLLAAVLAIVTSESPRRP